MNEITLNLSTCSNPDCRVRETGKCVEGFKVGECPHQTEQVGDDSSLGPEENEIATFFENERTDLFVNSGDILSIDEAVDILCSGQTIVLSIVGPTNSGKTTLGLSLYESFQEGPFLKWNFCGSQTLIAFEKRCHHARAKSGRDKPTTPHTTMADGLGFLHLAVHSHDTGRLNILISDRSGEYYKRIANNLEDCETLPEVVRADYVLFLIDGEILASDDRHGVANDFIMMVETLIEGGVIGKTHRIVIILTKYDLLSDPDIKLRAENDFDNLVKKYEKRFGHKVKDTKVHKIAARSESETIDIRYGVHDLLENCKWPRSFTPIVTPKERTANRAFLNLKFIGVDE